MPRKGGSDYSEAFEASAGPPGGSARTVSDALGLMSRLEGGRAGQSAPGRTALPCSDRRRYARRP